MKKLKYRFMDVCCCPHCGQFPLQLNIQKQNPIAYKLHPSKVYCEKYCGFNKTLIKKEDTIESLDCKNCFKAEIIGGKLTCPACKRSYPIKESTPILLEFFEADTDIKNKHAVLNVQKFWDIHPCSGKWDSAIEQYSTTENYRYKTHPWLKHLVPFNSFKEKRIIEIGCGQCIDFSQFCKVGAYAIGLDLTPGGISLGMGRLEYFGLMPYADLVLANVERIPFRQNSFDYVYSYGVIHHTKRTQTAINNIYGILKPNHDFNIMYYYTYSFTKIIEGTAKLLNKALVGITRDKDIMWKIIKKLSLGKSQRDVTSYLNTKVSATLHAPIIKTYSVSKSKKMFRKFKNLSFTLVHLHPIVEHFTGRGRVGLFLERHFGWDLVIKGKK